MLVALGVILLTFNILSGGKFFQPTNMVTLAVQASGIAVIATGHGPDHRVAQHRPVGRIAGRPHRHDLCPADDRLDAGPRDRAPTSRSGGLIALGARRRARGARRRAARASSSPTSACRRSSSPSAGCSRSAAWSGTSRSGAAVSGLDPTLPAHRRRGPGIGRRHRSPGSSASWAASRSSRLLINGRRQRRRFGFPAAADVGRGPDRRRRLRRRARRGRVRQREPLAARASPTGSPSSRTGARQPAGGWKIPTGFPYPIILLIGVTLVMTCMATSATVRAIRLRVSAATPMPPSSPASTRAGRSSRPTS